MNLYLISQDEWTGYDTYDSAVVCAESENYARLIHPYQGFKADIVEFNNGCDWASKPEQVKVKLIGKAEESMKPGVVCASYNAG